MKTRRLKDLHTWATTSVVQHQLPVTPTMLWHFLDGDEKPVHHVDARKILGCDPPTSYGHHQVETDRGWVRVLTIPA